MSLNALRRRLIPRWATSQFPAASEDNRGILAFDVTTGAYKQSNGTAWLLLGNGSGGGGVQLLTATAQFTAAQLDFNTDETDRTILVCPQEKIINPVSVWAKIEYPPTGQALPANNEGFTVGLHGYPANQLMMKLGAVPETAFSTSFKKTYYPVLSDSVYGTFVNQQVGNLEACSLKLRANGINGGGNNHSGGNYTLKFRVLYELSSNTDFI